MSVALLAATLTVDAVSVIDMAHRGTTDDEISAGEVRRIRLVRHLSQSELARLCGVSRSYVAQVESGRLQPRPSFLTRLSAINSESEPSGGQAVRVLELITSRPALTRTDLVKALGRRGSTERRIAELLSAGRLEERLTLGDSRDSRAARRLFIAGAAPGISRPDPTLEALRKHREKLPGMSQTELARRIGVTPAAIAKWEATGAVPPRACSNHFLGYSAQRLRPQRSWPHADAPGGRVPSLRAGSA